MAPIRSFKTWIASLVSIVVGLFASGTTHAATPTVPDAHKAAARTLKLDAPSQTVGSGALLAQRDPNSNNAFILGSPTSPDSKVNSLSDTEKRTAPVETEALQRILLEIRSINERLLRIEESLKQR